MESLPKCPSIAYIWIHLGTIWESYKFCWEFLRPFNDLMQMAKIQLQFIDISRKLLQMSPDNSWSKISKISDWISLSKQAKRIIFKLYLIFNPFLIDFTFETSNLVIFKFYSISNRFHFRNKQLGLFCASASRSGWLSAPLQTPALPIESQPELK